ncbi:MAG: glycosyltransferase family 4 protein, partial [Bacteroidota bacterium]
DPVGAKAGMDHYDNVLAEGLINNGAESVVFSNYSSTVDGGSAHHTIHNRDKNRFVSLLASFAGVIRSLHAAKRWGADRILLHVFRGGLVDLIYFLMTRIAGFRIIALVHDVESLESYSLPIFRRLVIGKLASTRLVHNTYSREQLLRIMGYRASSRISIIPHVHFLNLYTASPLRESDHTDLPSELKGERAADEIRLLFFGQIKRSKGLDLLLEAMRSLPPRIHLVVAGKIRDAEPEQLLRSIEESGMRERIHVVLRHISDTERDALFRNCDMLILPYRRIYQSGVLLMGMSAGIPVIASDLEPNRDAVIHGETGLLFQSGSVEDLIAQIIHLASDKALRKNLSAQAKVHIRSHYDPVKAGRLLLDSLSSKRRPAFTGE